MNVRELKNTVSNLVVERHAYYDRITLWLDTEGTVFDRHMVEAIEAQQAIITVYWMPPPKFMPEYRQKVELYQVNRETLRLVDQALHQNACGYLIKYIELSVDWVTQTPEDARQLHTLIEQRLIHRSPGFHYHRHLPTDPALRGARYFAARGPRKIVPVLYSDRQKARSGHRCCVHFEYRLLGTDACKRQGFRVLRNLLDRDLLGFMRDHVTFAAKPTKDAIGQAVPGAPLSTRRGYEKRCDRFLVENHRRYHDIPVQELLSWLPVLGVTLAVNTTYDQALVKQLFGDGNPGFT